jgi:hypothetical protein
MQGNRLSWRDGLPCEEVYTMGGGVNLVDRIGLTRKDEGNPGVTLLCQVLDFPDQGEVGLDRIPSLQ